MSGLRRFGLALAFVGTCITPALAPAVDTIPNAQTGAATVLKATVNLDASTIVGSTAGTLGHAVGVQVIAAPGAGKMIWPIACRIDYTRVTASYTGGGSVNIFYVQGGAVAGSGIGAAQTASGCFADADSGNSTLLYPFNVNGILTTSPTFTNASVNIQAASAFTQPGTAAGTGVVTCWYVVMQ